MKKKLHSVHPGEVLLEEFLKPFLLSQNRLALNIGVPARRINEIVLAGPGSQDLCQCRLMETPANGLNYCLTSVTWRDNLWT
jgi:hypothetical protein